MKYLVMECHLSYAVVLAEDGSFRKVANRNYQVGQRVTDVIPMEQPAPVSQPGEKKMIRWLGPMAAMAACLMLVFTAFFRQMPYASVYMTINPEVRIDVNRRDMVVGLEGINQDGQDLIADYSYSRKELDLVMDELVDLAIEMGYLHEGGQITLTLDAEDRQWVVDHGDTLTTHLNEHLTEKMTVTIEINDPNAVDIPVGESDYGDTDYGETTAATGPSETTGGEAGTTDHGDTDYGPGSDGDTDHDTPDDDGQSDYATEPSVDDGQSDYTTEPSVDDGDSDYQEPVADDGDSGYGDSGYDDDD